MSSAALLFVSSPACSKHVLLPMSGTKRQCGDKFRNNDFQCSCSKQGFTGMTLRDSTPHRSAAVKAGGLGRFSGAVHGNSQKKYRRRRPSKQQDPHQESPDDSERRPQVQEEGVGTKLGGGDDHGFRDSAPVDEIASTDGCPNGSQEFSFKRYLKEIGISPQVQDYNESPSASRDVPNTLEVKELKGQAVNDKTSSNLAGDPSTGCGHTVKKAVDWPAYTGLETRSTSSVSGISLVSETMVTNSENSLLEMDETKSLDHRVEMSERNNGESEAGLAAQSESLGSEDRLELSGSFSAGKKPGNKVKKKVPSKSPSKTTREKTDNQHVRVVVGGAEQPAILASVSRPETQLLSKNGAVTTLKVTGRTVEPNIVETAYEPQEAFRTEESLNHSAEMEPEFSEGRVVKGLNNAMKDSILTKLDSNFMMHTNDEGHTNSHLGDRPLLVNDEAGFAVLSLPPRLGDEQEESFFPRVAGVVVEPATQVRSQVVDTFLEQAVQVAIKVVPLTVVEQAAQAANKVAELPVVVVEQAAQVGSHVVEQAVKALPDLVSEQVSQVVDQVSDVAEQVANSANEQVQQVTESVSLQVTSTVENVTSTATQVVEQVTDFFTDSDESDSDDEFEAYKTSDLPEFRGKLGLDNFIVKQEGQGILSEIYDFYNYMLKRPLPEFAAAMFSAPIAVSAIFTVLYLPQFEGLAFDDTARDFYAVAGGNGSTLQMSWSTVFEVFMFSLSLSTGLQPELTPLLPYTLVVANINALVAQLVFVFLSGSVFARLSQPSQPVRCSTVALVSTSRAQRRKENAIKIFTARYVLAGPQPCELVDVKVDLTYKYNTVTRTGSYFRATQSLKLVRSEIAFLTHGMLVRHVIDENSPLYQRTPEMLRTEDAVFCLSVVGLERASMQSVFHVQHYCVADDHLVWGGEFEDIILINKNNRVVDHSRLSRWRPVTF